MIYILFTLVTSPSSCLTIRKEEVDTWGVGGWAYEGGGGAAEVTWKGALSCQSTRYAWSITCQSGQCEGSCEKKRCKCHSLCVTALK